VLPDPAVCRRPSLAVTYQGGDAALRDRLLPLVDTIEFTPDTLALVQGGRVVPDRERLAELAALARTHRVVAHGVGLSPASHEGCDAGYLELIDRIFAQVPVAWHSEHLGYTQVDGCFLGTMLAPTRQRAVADQLADRLAAVRRRQGLPFLIEHVAQILPDPGGELSPAVFLSHIAAASGSGILLDCYNLECDAANHGLDLARFFAELDWSRVRELHLAGGNVVAGMQLDVHCQVTRPSTRQLAEIALARAPQLDLVVFEVLQEAVPLLGHDAIVAEVADLAGWLDHAFAGDAAAVG